MEDSRLPSDDTSTLPSVSSNTTKLEISFQCYDELVNNFQSDLKKLVNECSKEASNNSLIALEMLKYFQQSQKSTSLFELHRIASLALNLASKDKNLFRSTTPTITALTRLLKQFASSEVLAANYSKDVEVMLQSWEKTMEQIVKQIEEQTILSYWKAKEDFEKFNKESEKIEKELEETIIELQKKNEELTITLQDQTGNIADLNKTILELRNENKKLNQTLNSITAEKESQSRIETSAKNLGSAGRYKLTKDKQKKDTTKKAGREKLIGWVSPLQLEIIDTLKLSLEGDLSDDVRRKIEITICDILKETSTNRESLKDIIKKKELPEAISSCLYNTLNTSTASGELSEKYANDIFSRMTIIYQAYKEENGYLPNNEHTREHANYFGNQAKSLEAYTVLKMKRNV